MKKFVFLLILFISVVGVMFYFRQGNKTRQTSQENLDHQPVEQIGREEKVENKDFFQDSEYKISWLIVRDVNKISLSSNLEDKLSSEEARLKLSCHYLISGGFYNQAGKHIGLFISDGQKMEKSIDSATFNGFFYISEKKRAEISTSPPTAAYLGLQSGPLLLTNSKAQRLNIVNDENARRVVVATNREGLVIFLVVYNHQNPIKGPKLSELPGIILNLEKDLNFGLEAALNLDGGAHSAFFSNNLALTELSPIGSYFCIKSW